MSSIDTYRFTCLGVIECPTPYRMFVNQESVQFINVAIYHLEQDIPIGEIDFQGKEGDVLVGRGGGEASVMLIKIPEAIVLYTDVERFIEQFPSDNHRQVYKAYWDMTSGYKLMAGFETLGWNAEKVSIEIWLTEHVLNFLLTNFPDRFQQYAGGEPLGQDGSICRVITSEEDKVYNWRKYRKLEK